MSVWQNALPSLQGEQGDLLSVRITAGAELLEELLETLAETPFPINPEICHGGEVRRQDRTLPAVTVEFPAWRRWIPELERALAAQHFEAEIQVNSMLEEIRT